MNECCNYLEKRPIDCNENELAKFHELVLKGEKVQKDGLLGRIKNCVVLGYCIYENKIIGISAIKQPQKDYVKKVITMAQLDRHWNQLKYEIGYSFTEPEFRHRGISTKIKSNLLIWMRNHGGTIFSTTAIPSSQRFLEANGFINFGIPYNGANDKDLKYFELTINT